MSLLLMFLLLTTTTSKQTLTRCTTILANCYYMWSPLAYLNHLFWGPSKGGSIVGNIVRLSLQIFTTLAICKTRQVDNKSCTLDVLYLLHAHHTDKYRHTKKSLTTLPMSKALWLGLGWRLYQYCQWLNSTRLSGSSKNVRETMVLTWSGTDMLLLALQYRL